MQKQIDGSVIDVTEEGYMTNHMQWNRHIAEELAHEVGIATLTPEHWKVIDFIDTDFKEKGTVPGIRRVNKVGGIPTKLLYELFPDGPIKKASKIAGCPKPASCV